MTTRWHVADVFRAGEAAFMAEWGSTLSTPQRRTLRDIMLCRTAALGGHVDECNACGHRRVHYNSCRNRHCPRCQAGARAAWFQAREAELLPIPYFHVVFTLPQELMQLAQQNQRVLYRLLFHAASQTLLQVAADPRHLGARIGVLAVLHTWGQTLVGHPHLHCIATGGGLDADAAKWIPARRSRRTGAEFFLPVRVLSCVFRGKFIAGLKRAFAEGELCFFGELAELADPARFEELLTTIVRRPWVVFAKRPFGGPRQVLKYLARYTHRVAISDQRIQEVTAETVTFGYKDYADGNVAKQLTLSHVEFIRRFLLHVLPSGFSRVRYYGFWANRERQANLQRCRELLLSDAAAANEAHPSQKNDPWANLELRNECCPHCQVGHMLVVEEWEPNETPLPRPPHFRQKPVTTEDAPVTFVDFTSRVTGQDTS